MKKSNSQKASTLIEIIFYFSIFSVVLLVAMTFALQIMQINQLSTHFTETQNNADFISEKIISTIQNADSINDAQSTFDNDQGALALNMPDAQISPTKFHLSNNDLYITEGSTSPVKLNSAYTKIDILRFQKISFTKAPDQIKLDINFSLKNNQINQLDKEINISQFISLRK